MRGQLEIYSWGKPVMWKMKAKAEKWKQVFWKKQQWYGEKEKFKDSYTFRRLKEAILFVEPEIEVILINKEYHRAKVSSKFKIWTDMKCKGYNSSRRRCWQILFVT